MADYWGLEAIAARMGVSRDTLLRWYDEQRFLMYKRWRKQGARKAQHVWFTDDELIARWMTAQCHAQWRERRRTRPVSPPGSTVDDAAAKARA